MKVTNLSIDRATTVLMIVILIGVLGVSAYFSLPREAAPDVTIPIIIVTTNYTGVSPEDIEKSITIPIEKAMKGISDVEEIRSSSMEGMSLVRIEFTSDVDLDTARQKVDAKISEAKDDSAWPEANPDLSEPLVSEINLQEYPILWVNLQSGAWIDELRFAAEGLARMAQLLEDPSVATDPTEIHRVAAATLEHLRSALAKTDKPSQDAGGDAETDSTGLSPMDLQLLRRTDAGVRLVPGLASMLADQGAAPGGARAAVLRRALAEAAPFDPEWKRLAEQVPADDDPIALGRLVGQVRTLSIQRLRLAAMICMNLSNGELLRLRKVAEDIEDLVEANPNVLDAEVVGGVEREIRVELDPDRLAAYRIPVADVLQLVLRENVSVTGGAVEVGRAKETIRFDAEFTDPEDLTRLMATAPNGKPLYLTDVADVVYDFKEPTTYSRLNGAPSVSLSIQKRSGTNIIQTADWCKARIAEYWEDSRPHGITYRITNDISVIIRLMVEDLENNIVTGLILVLGVVFFAMGGRNALFVSLAIPLSMMMGFATLQAMGVTLNFVVLFSLTLALGMLVDNAIVIVENIYRHLQEGLPLREAAKRGAGQVAWPVISSTATTVAAFVPIVFWSGIMGQFMRYLPMTVMIVLASSLFVAVVVNPAVCSRLMKLKKRKRRQATEDSTILEDVRAGRPVRSRTLRTYGRVVGWAVRHRWLTLGIALGALVLSILLYGSLGMEAELFPHTDPARGFVDIRCPEGGTLDATDQIVRKVEQRVLQFLHRGKDETDPNRNIKTVLATTGFVGQGGFFGSAATGSNEGRVTFEFLDFQDRNPQYPSQGTVDRLREMVKDIPGARIVVEQEKEGPPRDAPVTVEVSGERFETLARLRTRIHDNIKDTPGLVDLKDDYVKGRPELRFEVDRKRARMFGLDTSAIASIVKTAVGGAKVGIWRDAENEEIDIVVRLQKQHRNNPKKIEQLYLTAQPTPGVLRQVPLSNVASWRTSAGRGVIKRIDQKRTITLSGNNELPYQPAQVLKAVQGRLEGLPLPTGYSINYTGEKEEQDKATRFLLIAGIAAILLIWLVLVTQFNSLAMPAIIMAAVLLSLIGVFFGLWITHTAFIVIMTGIGVISLAGVVVNNGIVLIDYIQVLRRDEGLDLNRALVCAGMTRLRPVLLTAVTTILGLVPMATGISLDVHHFRINLRSESSEWWGPMANAVIFGLAFATGLTLVVVPALYSLLAGASDPGARQARRARKTKAVAVPAMILEPAAKQPPPPAEPEAPPAATKTMPPAAEPQPPPEPEKEPAPVPESE
jgi:multidrug efflux pump subunit AcrB